MAYSGGSEDHQLKLQFNKAEIHLESTGPASALLTNRYNCYVVKSE